MTTSFSLYYIPPGVELELAAEAADLPEAEAIVAGFDEEESRRRTGYKLVIAVE